MFDVRERPAREQRSRGASASQQFERRLRADTRLNAAARLAWLMCALSHKYGSAYMAAPRMASELGVSTNTVRAGLKKLITLGLFEPERVGSRRPNKYRRARPPPGAVPDGSANDKAAFVRWVRWQRRLDLATRAAWLLADLCAHDGHGTVSMAEIGAQLNTHKNNARAAVRRLLDLVLFTCEPATGRGHRNTYRPVGYIADVVAPAGEMIEREDAPGKIIDDQSPGDYFEELLRWQKRKRNS
jgi:hypothetical protein